MGYFSNNNIKNTFSTLIETEDEDIDLTELSDEELDDFINGNL